MLNCFDVADYFLSLTSLEAGDLISNMKIQKLVYYAQGFNLAIFSKPMFQEKIEAWTYGPVCPDLYHKYKKYDSNAIPVSNNVDFSKYNADTRDLLDEVYEIYGQYSAWKLMNLTHEEPPWRDTKPGETITHDAMETYFKTLLTEK